MTENKQEEKRTYSESEVLEIVDNCFHAFASNYRGDAAEYTKKIMERKNEKA